MNQQEITKLDTIAAQHNTHTDFDGVLAHYSGLLIAANIHGGMVLEAGCSTGVMTPVLLERATELEVVEGSPHYAQVVKERFGDRLKMHVALFEEFRPPHLYDTVVAAGVLHHLSNPLSVVRQFATWLKPGGDLHITVPNMTAFHRQMGVEMGLVPTVDSTSERNRFFQQPGRFNKESLERLTSDAGFEIGRTESFFFNQFTLSSAVLDGLFKMGQRYPELACQLYVHARKPVSP
jgi:2-polyprenyl-3-methyl-5-hydroxy-6-metoxy-1,4-benzoquinol methylase